ncbi:MAG: HAD family hydrolase [Acidobacteria bacterium]|nr:MAG: HAD family hydrolase [Acidobacteriota bacterium]
MRAVIFDFDGVLVDSEKLHFRAQRDALIPEGIAIEEEEYYLYYLAYDDRGAIRIALERHGQAADRARVAAIAERKARIFAELLPKIPFFPGARELVRSLARDYPLGVASGARRPEIEAILAASGMRDAFAAIVGAEDVRHSKPDPEPYLAAMEHLSARASGLRPADCLVFEDSVPGIASARAAGMKVVGVTNSYPAAKLGAAHRVVDSLEGLTPAELLSLFAV